MNQELIELRKREKALYQIAYECFEELYSHLSGALVKSRLDQVIERQIKYNLDKGYTGEQA